MPNTEVGTINYRRVAIGGLCASVALLVCQFVWIGYLSGTIMAAREAARMPVFTPRPLLSVLELLTTGFLLVWLHAAMRPRFGAGIGTAIRSGIVVWVCLGMIGTIHMMSDNFGLPDRLLLVIAAGMLPGFVMAGIAGAWAYRE